MGCQAPRLWDNLLELAHAHQSPGKLPRLPLRPSSKLFRLALGTIGKPPRLQIHLLPNNLLRQAFQLLSQHAQVPSTGILPDTVFPPDFTRLVLVPEEVVELHKAEHDVRRLQLALAEKLVQAEKQILKLVADALPALFFPVIAEFLKEIERGVEFDPHQIVQRIIHPVRVPVFFQHVLQPFQADDVGKGQHIVAEHFVRRVLHIHVVVFRCVVPQTGAAQHFQEPELQFLRRHRKHIVKCFAERSVIFLRQAGDQIQMLRDFAAFLDLGHGAGQFREVLPSLHQLIRRIVRRLHPDLETENAGRRILGKIIQHLRPHDVSGDLKLEHAAAMVLD
ncbi:hypothetical protein D3C77_364360 [compost metagenome]